MLLLTDRPNEGLAFQKVFEQVGPCEMVTLDHATDVPADHDVIACHASLETAAARGLLDAALTHHRASIATPVMFLVPENNPKARFEATAFNATEIVPQTASRERLLLTIRRIVTAQQRGEFGVLSSKGRTQDSISAVGHALTHLLSAAGRREMLSIAVLDKGADALLTSIKLDTIKNWLAVVRSYDNVTFQHCLLVAGLVTAFASRLGLTQVNQRLLAQAALIHDVGKAHIPQAILNKAGPLTAAEMQVMQTHPAIGHAMLTKQSGIDPAILDVVRHHHEYLDGSGYPDGLSGRQVSEFVRLVTICDIYAALIERRAYKAPMSPQEARAILVGMGNKLDASLLKAFDGIIQDS